MSAKSAHIEKQPSAGSQPFLRSVGACRGLIQRFCHTRCGYGDTEKALSTAVHEKTKLSNLGDWLVKEFNL